MALVALAICACGSEAGGVLVVTVDSAGRVPAVASFRVVATSGGHSSMPISVPLAHGPADIPPAQTFALAFDASRNGAVHVTVDALGSDGATLASGTGDSTISPGQETMVTVLLGGAVVGDMASMDGTSVGDAGIFDMTTGEGDAPDLAMPDLAVPDLAVACGVCSPGQQRTVACGNCGMETDTCTQSCQWFAGTCMGQGACAPAATMACGMCGTSTCGNNCQWGSCSGQGPCSPGATTACGNCGTSTCGNNCQWGGCNGSGPCSPGATQQGSCDQCSQQVCGNNCQWKIFFDPYGSGFMTPCTLKSGNACSTQQPYNIQICQLTSQNTGHQYCRSDICQWGGCQ